MELALSDGTTACVKQAARRSNQSILKEIKPVNPKGNQSWIFIGRTDAKAKTPILWPPDGKNWHWKRPWCWERWRAGGEGDDRGWDGWMASQLNGHESEQIPGDSGGQGSLACCSPWGCKESDTTKRPLKKGMATHSSILGIPWTEGPGELQSMGLQIVRQTERLTLSPGNVGVELKGLKDWFLLPGMQSPQGLNP